MVYAIRPPDFVHPTGMVNAAFIPHRFALPDTYNQQWRIETVHRILELEANLFPKTLAQRAKRIDVSSSTTIQGAFNHFLDRFNDHYFPIEVDVMMEEIHEEVSTWLTWVPVIVEGVDYNGVVTSWWRDDDPDYIFLEDNIVDVLMCLAQPEMFGDASVPEPLQDVLDATPFQYLKWAYPQLPLPDEQFRLDGLPAFLREMALPTPLNHLADAVEYVLKETRNPFLDWSQQELAEGGVELYWDNTDELLRLGALWGEAEPYLEGIALLNDWCTDGGSLPNNRLPYRDSVLRRYGQIVQTLTAAWRMKAGQLQMSFPD